MFLIHQTELWVLNFLIIIIITAVVSSQFTGNLLKFMLGPSKFLEGTDAIHSGASASCEKRP